jgi:predicted GNAT family acetyltransferase
VDALNSTPIQLYERLGFVHVADYEEHEVALG